MTSVIVTHPGLQHSHQLAWALHERALLQAFWSGVPVISKGEKPPIWLTQSYVDKIKKVAIPPELRKNLLFFQALIRAEIFLPEYFSSIDYTHRIFHLFDWWVSKHITSLRPKIVIAYENSAYHTFRAAKTIGARCILDAASIHHVAQSKLMTVKQTPYLSEINRRKNEEIELADLILTCSPLSAKSYIDQGVASSKVQPILLGATLPENIEKWQIHSKPLKFIFAGSLRYLKSIDLILQAFSILHTDGLDFRLYFVGGISESLWVEAINKTKNATYLGNLSQIELYQQLAQADCLLLPSRFDSFGMVVAEAMACGTPAIVSVHTGAKALIEEFPGSGWIIECNLESLYKCIKDKIENRDKLVAARKIATQASQHFTWQAYRKRVGQLIENFI